MDEGEGNNLRSKVAVFLSLCVLGLGPSLRAQQVDSASRVYAEASNSVFVLIVIPDNGGAGGQGSGFLVRDGKIVTNEHVVRGGNVFVELETSRVPAKVEAVDALNDLAVISVTSGLSAKPLTISESIPEPGTSIFAIGNPIGLERTISSGVISGIREISGRQLLQITTPISPGSSGGPILNSRGEVVGVAVAALIIGQNLNFAVPASEVARLLRGDVSAKPKTAASAQPPARVRNSLPISVRDLRQGFQSTYKNELVSVRGWVATERRVSSQTYKGYYLKDRYGDLILVRTTAPLPDISSEVLVTGVALLDADSGDIYISETGGPPPPPPPPPPQPRGWWEWVSEHLPIVLVAIGVAVLALVGVAIYLMRRNEGGTTAPISGSKTGRTVDDFKTVKVYKTTKVFPGTLVVMENRQETDIVHLTDQTGRGEIEIGRDSPDVSGGIRIKDKTNTLSRRQARLAYASEAREFKLLNLAGENSNPTIINGRQMAENESIVLKDGDVLTMGSVEFKFRQK